ncbi:MAG: hypothetical protein E5W19_16190 [Mesorhizobium sp.]|nr:hypothetical protein EOA35_16985 [Mesorhizobium sp. M8A.F.Ca.ET.023.01.1.1]RWC71319.1 MAG: hypothetical protein EOS71_23695 [Mesorhizobium sp.]TIU48792.1 MAG: hypothetical protein E5W19_16190 [Mesorhizobium sp.]
MIRTAEAGGIHRHVGKNLSGAPVRRLSFVRRMALEGATFAQARSNARADPLPEAKRIGGIQILF